MALSHTRNRQWLKKKSKQGFQGYPLATIALYGPTDKIATKVAVGYAESEGQEPNILERFTSEDAETDIRNIVGIESEIGRLLELYNVKSVVMTDRIIGCPHEEGIDYPEGEACPECPFWENKDRWAGEAIQ